MPQIITPDDFVRKIENGSTVLVVPMPSEEIYPAFRRIFEATGSPRDLTVVWAAGLGPFSEAPRGMNHFAVPGMVKRIIAGHMGLNHAIIKLIATNQIEAYNLPQGVLCQLYREISAGRLGLFTRTGLGTFMDPRLDGGRLNERTRTCEDLVEVVTVDGHEMLLYKSFPLQAGIIRGTSADPWGNITLENEGLSMENLEGAMAVKRCGGFVVAQVERVTDEPANPHHVAVPGNFVDYVVVASSVATHPQTLFVDFDPSFSGQTRVDLAAELAAMPLTAEKIICRRAAMELRPGTNVNLGIGIPMGVARVAFEEGILDEITLNTEIGVFGGLPEGGKNFGPARNPKAFVSPAAMFDFYDGGGLDLSCVGMVQCDADGNVNVSKLGPRIIGSGGFINITTAAKKLIFCGEFSAVGFDVAVRDGELHIREDGKVTKFVSAVEQITFSGKVAREDGRDVLYVTERCVFRLVPEGMMLVEIAPGVDLQRDIIDRMAFVPIIPDRVALMPAAIFEDKPMGLAENDE
jgi:propionate CoA-transferase